MILMLCDNTDGIYRISNTKHLDVERLSDIFCDSDRWYLIEVSLECGWWIRSKIFSFAFHIDASTDNIQINWYFLYFWIIVCVLIILNLEFIYFFLNYSWISK